MKRCKCLSKKSLLLINLEKKREKTKSFTCHQRGYWSRFVESCFEICDDLDACDSWWQLDSPDDADDNIENARGITSRIPGALERVVTGGVAWEPVETGPYAALRLRHFGDYPLIEDNSVRAEPASLLNLNAGWRFGPLRIGASVLNLLDSEDADIAYFYASRVAGEPAGGVEDVHFHPVEPRQLRLSVRWGD